MLKKTITYKDYNGTERTEDFYFNLTKAEVMEMEMSTSGGLARTLLKLRIPHQLSRFLKISFLKLMVKSLRMENVS